MIDCGNRRPETGKVDFQTLGSPAARAVLDYQAHGCGKKFRKHLRDHLANGYVFSTPSFFALFKAVQLDDERIAWFFTYLNGDLRQMAEKIPFPLPYVAFARYRHGRERVRVYLFERFLQICNRQSAIGNS